MSERYPFQGSQSRIRRESSYGVAGSGDWVRLNGLGMTLTPSVTTNPVNVPGLMVPAGVTVDDIFGTGALSGALDYNALLFVLAGIFGNPTLTSLGGSPAAYQWDFSWKGRKPNRPVPFSIANGYAQLADSALGWIFNSLTIGGGRPDGFTVSGDGFAKAVTIGGLLGGVTLERQTLTITGTPTGGDFTITALGETTAAIAFDATAAAVKTALVALNAFDTADLTVGGGPLPGTAVTIDFTGYYAGEDVALMTTTDSLTGGTTPASAIVETTPGDDEVADIPQVVAGAVQGDVWIDSAWASLGTTQAMDALGSEVAIGERMSRVTPINSSLSSDGVIDVADQSHMVNLTLARNAVSGAEIAKLVAGTPTFVRQKWTGPTISGANKYMLQVDSSLRYESVGEGTDTQAVYTLPFSGRMMLDPVSGNVVAVRLVNAVASLEPSAA